MKTKPKGENLFQHKHNYNLHVSLISEKQRAADFCRSTLSEKARVLSECSLSALIF